MSLDKAIEHGKERRKPYTGSKAIDKTCCNHGGCQWCEENRKHKYEKQKEAAQERIWGYKRTGSNYDPLDYEDYYCEHLNG